MRNKKNLTRGTNLIPLITGYWEQSCQRSDLIQAQLKGGFFSSSRSIGRGSDPARGYRGGPGAEPSHPCPMPSIKHSQSGICGDRSHRGIGWAPPHQCKELGKLSPKRNQQLKIHWPTNPSLVQLCGTKRPLQHPEHCNYLKINGPQTSRGQMAEGG